MAHDCNDCGETFETLSALRLHDCSDAADESGADREPDSDTGTETGDAASPYTDDSIDRRQQSIQRDRQRRARRATSDELDDALERARDGDPDAAVAALARFERELEAVAESDVDGDTYRDVYWGYYEPMATALDAVSREEGWSFLLDVVSAYDPRDEWWLPIVGDPITNVVARNVIRTRLTAGVDAVPTEVLEYLAVIPQINAGEGEIAWEESVHYGWAIGHPEHDVAGTIRDIVRIDEIWASAAALRALYADQHEGVSLYCEVLRETPPEDRPITVDALSHFEGEPTWEIFPRYWEFETEFDRGFEFAFDESVERQLRATIEDVGLADGLREDWSFEDLEYEWNWG